MNAKEIQPRVLEIVAEQLSLPVEEVRPESSFIDDLGADSLDIVELIMEMEEEFGTEIPDEDIEKMNVVQDVISYVSKKVSQES